MTALLKDERSKVTVIANPDILRGGCLVKRDDSLVDATIEAKCQTVFEQLANQANRLSQSSEEAEVLDADRIQAIADRFQSDDAK